MKSSVFVVLSFTIIVVPLVANGSEEKTNIREFKNSLFEDVAVNNQSEAITTSSEAKKGTESLPAKRQAKKKSKQKKNDNVDEEIDKNLTNILKDDLSLDQLTQTDPTELGQKINNIRDTKKRKQLIKKLKDAWTQNRRTLPGKFYQVAYASFLRAKEATNASNKQFQRGANNTANESHKFMKSGSNLLGRAVLGDSNDNVKKISRIGLLDIGMV